MPSQSSAEQVQAMIERQAQAGRANCYSDSHCHVPPLTILGLRAISQRVGWCHVSMALIIAMSRMLVCTDLTTRWPRVPRRRNGESGNDGMTDSPRGRYFGSRVGAQPANEAEHFMRCPACAGWIDCRDLAQVFEHEGPLPHPAQDRPQ